MPHQQENHFGLSGGPYLSAFRMTNQRYIFFPFLENTNICVSLSVTDDLIQERTCDAAWIWKSKCKHRGCASPKPTAYVSGRRLYKPLAQTWAQLRASSWIMERRQGVADCSPLKMQVFRCFQSHQEVRRIRVEKLRRLQEGALPNVVAN